MVDNQQNNTIYIWAKEQINNGYAIQAIKTKIIESGYDESIVEKILAEKNVINNNQNDKINKINKHESSSIKLIIAVVSIGLIFSLFFVFNGSNSLPIDEQTHQDVSYLYNSFFENKYCGGEINESFELNSLICNFWVLYSNNLLINNLIGVYSFNFNSFQDDLKQETGSLYSSIDGDLYNLTVISLIQFNLFDYFNRGFISYFIDDAEIEFKENYFNKIFNSETLSYSKMLELNTSEKSDELMSFCYTAFNTYLDITKDLMFEGGSRVTDNYTNINYSFFETFIESNIDINNNISEIYKNNIYDLGPYFTKIKFSSDLMDLCINQIKFINSRITIENITFNLDTIQFHLKNTGIVNISMDNNDYRLDGIMVFGEDSCVDDIISPYQKTICEINKDAATRLDLSLVTEYQIMVSNNAMDRFYIGDISD